MVLRVLNASLDNLQRELRLAHPAQAGHDLSQCRMFPGGERRVEVV